MLQLKIIHSRVYAQALTLAALAAAGAVSYVERGDEVTSAPKATGFDR